MDTLTDKLSAFFKGPGWFPGTERLGDLQMVPEVFASPDNAHCTFFFVMIAIRVLLQIQKRDIYDPDNSLFSRGYALLHFSASVIIASQIPVQVSLFKNMIIHTILKPFIHFPADKSVGYLVDDSICHLDTDIPWVDI